MSPMVDPARLVEAIEGPKITISARLVQLLEGDFGAAAFLAQGAYFSALKRKADGWFDFPQEGEPEVGDSGDEEPNIFTRLGSWRALLGLTPDAQKAIRRKLKGKGLLEEKLKGTPARLHYRFDSGAYLAFLAQEIRQFPKTRKQDSRKSETSCPENQKQESGFSPTYSRELSRELSNTTTTAPPDGAGAAGGGIHVYLEELPAGLQEKARHLFEGLAPGVQADVVDELLGQIEEKVVKQPERLLRTLARAARDGKLTLDYARRHRERRRTREEAAVAREIANVLPVDDAAKEKGASLLQRLAPSAASRFNSSSHS